MTWCSTGSGPIVLAPFRRTVYAGADRNEGRIPKLDLLTATRCRWCPSPSAARILR